MNWNKFNIVICIFILCIIVSCEKQEAKRRELAAQLIKVQKLEYVAETSWDSRVDYAKKISFPGLSDSIWNEVSQNITKEDIYTKTLIDGYSRVFNTIQLTELIGIFKQNYKAEPAKYKIQIDQLTFLAYAVDKAVIDSTIESYLREKSFISDTTRPLRSTKIVRIKKN